MSHILAEKLSLKYSSRFSKGILNLHLHVPQEYLQLFKCSAEWRYCGSWWIHFSTISMSLTPRFISSASLLQRVLYTRMIRNLWVFLSNQDLPLLLSFLLLYHSSSVHADISVVVVGSDLDFGFFFEILFSEYVLKKDYRWEGVYLRMHNNI